LVGVWIVESFYSEFKATGRRMLTAARPTGYTIFTPEKRITVILTAEQAHPQRPYRDACSVQIGSMVLAPRSC
jgi:hypothetical protein